MIYCLRNLSNLKNRQLIFLLVIIFYANCLNGQILNVLSVRKVSNDSGNLGNILPAEENFGDRVSNLGDWDGDGVPDLAVSCPTDNDGGIQRGAFYIILMNKNGTVKAKHKISQTSGNLGVTFPSNKYDFGKSVAAIGDLDGDGVNDLAVTS